MANETGTNDNRGVAHAVEVDKLILSNHAGQNVDLKKVFTEVSVSSSIFTPGIRGSVLVYDAHSLINRHPIVGEERLYLSYKTPGNVAKEGVFRVWKITDEEPDDKGASSVYRLHFCSPTIFHNALHNVAKSYTNTDDAGAIIEQIMGEYLDFGSTEKKLEKGTLPMKDPAKVLVIPFYSPFEAIDMILRRAYSGEATKSDYYVFFERADGWQVKMIDELVSNPINARQREAGVVTQEQVDKSPDASKLETWYVYASDKFQTDTTEGRDIRRIVTLKLAGRFDSIQKIDQGMFENEVVQYSLVEKSLTSQNYKSLDNERRLLGGDLEYSTSTVTQITGKERVNTPGFISNFSTIAAGYSGSSASKVFFRLKDPEEKDGVVKKSGWSYQAMRTAMAQVQVTIVVPGDSMVDVGDIVHLSIPKFESVLERAEEDDFIYGKYIVGAIRDSILSPDKHTMTLDLYRDSFSKPIGASRVLDENSTQ